MCNHYRNDPVIQAGLQTWREYIGWSLEGEVEGSPADIWPKREGLVIRADGDRRIADRMIWGVPLTLPGKRPGTTITKQVTNVRNLTSPFWKSTLTRPAQRCLVPFTRFAEPRIGAGREEHWFTVKDAAVSVFAGLWRPSEAGNHYAFLTCEPNPLIAPLHPKAMPVILHPGDYETWLAADYETACALATPFPSQLMSVE